MYSYYVGFVRRLVYLAVIVMFLTGIIPGLLSSAYAALNQRLEPSELEGNITYDVSSEDMQSLILAFKIDPLHPKMHFLEGAIFDFADRNKDVMVVIHSRVLKGLTMKNDMHRKLFIAFVAGNLLPQLQKKIKKDHSFEGITFMIDIYQKLRTRKQLKPVSNLETLKSMSTVGLIQYVHELEENSKKVVPQP